MAVCCMCYCLTDHIPRYGNIILRAIHKYLVHRMTAIYICNSTVADSCQQPTWLQYSQQQTCADTVTGAILQIPYVQPVQDPNQF